MMTLLAVLTDDSGATAIEYGLIAALVSVLIAATLNPLGETLNQTFIQSEERICQALLDAGVTGVACAG